MWVSFSLLVQLIEGKHDGLLLVSCIFIMMARFIARLHERGAFIIVCLLPKSKILP